MLSRILNLVQHDSGVVLAVVVSALLYWVIATHSTLLRAGVGGLLAMTGDPLPRIRSLGFGDFGVEFLSL